MSIDIEVINLTANTESVERAAEKIEKLVDAGQEAQKAANKLEALIQRLNDKAELMAKGFTRGEATIIAQAKSLGALGDSLEKVIDPLVRIRELSKDPFDSAIGSIRRLEQEFEQLANRAGLAQKGIYLTSQQLREYSRIAAEVKGQLISEGIKPSDSRYQEEFNKRLKEAQRIYLDTAVTINQLKREEEELLQKNKLAAEQAARQEEERRRQIQKTAEFEAMVRRAKIEQIEKQNRQELDALNAYFRQLERESMIAERNLQRLNKAISREQIINDLQSQGYSASVAGKAATLQLRGASKETVDLYLREAAAREKAAKAAREQAAAAEYLRSVEERLKAALDSTNKELSERSVSTLVKYEKALQTMGIQGEAAAAKLATVRNQLKQVADKEIEGRMRDLSRAISVQMGDVAISLASGMNPFLVLVQQGDQIRSAFEQAALSSEKSKQAMLAATGMIAESVVDTAKAVGTFFVGAIMTAGNATLSFAAKVIGLNLTLQAVNETLVATGVVGTRFATVITTLATAITSVVGIAVTATAVFGGAFIAGIVSAIKEQNQLAVVLNTTGGLLAMNTQQVIAYAQSISNSNVSTSEAIQVISEMAKAGNLGRESIEMITESAKQMKRLAGVAIEDTVKAFSKMADEPTKALIELAKRTGDVSPEVISLVQKLEDQGRKGEAAAIAMKALADANAEAARRIEEDLHPVSKFIAYLGELVKGLWEDIKDISRRALGGSTIAERIQDINNSLNTPSMFGWIWNDDLRKQRDALNRMLLNQVEREIEVAAQQERNAKAAEMIARIEELRKKNLTEVQKLQEESLRLSNELVKAYQLFGAESEQVKVIQQAILNTEKQIAEVEKRKDRKDISKGETEAEKLEKYYTKALEKVTDLEIRTKEVAEGQKELSAAQKMALDLFNDKEFSKLTDAEKIVLVTKLEQIHAQEQVNLAKKLSLEYSKELVKYNEQSAELTKKIADEYARTQQKIVEETERLDMRKQLLGASEEQAKAITREYEKQAALSKIDAELSQRKLRIQADFLKLANDNLQDFDYEGYNRAITDAEKQAQEQRKLIVEEYNLKNAEDTVAKFRSIQNTITDIIATAIFEGGDAGSRKLKDVLKNAFRNFVINVVINPIVGGVLGAFGLPASALGASLSGASGATGAIGAVSNAYGIFNSVANLGTTIAGIGNFIGSATTAAFGTGVTLGTEAASAAIAAYNAAGMSNVASALSAGAKVGSATSGAMSAAMSAAPYLAAGTVVLNGLGVFRSKKIVGGGLMGTLGEGDIKSYDLQRKGGTLFSGPEYSIKNVQTSPMSKALQDTFDAMRKAAARMAEQLGIAGDQFLTFTTRLGDDLIHPDTGGYGIKFDGLNEQQRQEAVEKALANANDKLSLEVLRKAALAEMPESFLQPFIEQSKAEMAEKANKRGSLADRFGNIFRRFIFGRFVLLREAEINRITAEQRAADEYIKQFAKEGETASQTLVRLTSSLQVVNSGFDLLNATLLDTGIRNADLASKLIDAFGGIEKFNSATQTYFKLFYSEEEQLAEAVESMNEAFSALGLTMPQTKKQFRDLVEAQDVTTESGRKTYAALLNMAEAFNAAQSSIDGISRTLKDLADQVTAVFSQLRNQIAGVRGSVTSSIDSIRGRAVMTPDQIRSAIQGAMVTPPTTTGLSAATAQVSAAQAHLTQMNNASAQANAVRDQAQARLNDLQAALRSVQGQLASLAPPQDQFIRVRSGFLGLRRKTIERPGYQQELAEFYRRSNKLRGQIDSLSVAVAQQQSTFTAAAESAKFYAQQLEAAKAALTAAQDAQVAAQEQYAHSVRQFVIDAGKSVEKLDDLRQSVIAYYESQRELAEAMLGSAARLRDVVNAVRFGQLSRELLPSQLMAQFQHNYAMALATTDLTRAQYADRLADSLPQLSDSLRATASSREEWILATARLVTQANTVASLLEQTAPRDYQQQSLDLLGDIDRALSSIEVSAASAEKVISDAIYETGAQNLTGLRAIVATLRGESVPRFALGGQHTGGIRLVGENGPELEVTGPARYWSFNQTRRMMNSGNSAEVVEAIKALNENISMLRAEVRADVSHNAKVARILDRVVQESDALLVSVQS